MLARILIVICFITSTSLIAEEESKLGLDYLQLTQNKVLTEIMQNLEPKLITFYNEQNLSFMQKKYGVRGIAISLAKDKTYKTIIDRIKGVSPETLQEFLKLPKNDYPMLWAIGEGERLKQELASSLKLYNALHGKDYVKN